MTNALPLHPRPLRRRVLIVEDHPDTAETTSIALELLGCATAVAHTGVEGWRLMQEWQPDVALVDIMLPGMTGIDWARQIHAESKQIAVPCIAISGYYHPQLWEDARAAGFATCLLKPVNIVNLKMLIETLCECQPCDEL